MSLEILEGLGLTQNEAKIYRTLLDLKQGSIGDISEHANIHRRNTYDAIKRLLAKGLAYQVLPKKTLTFGPVHPDKLKELLEEKNDELNSLLPGLVKKFETINASQSVYVYKGVGGLRNYMDLILKEGKDIFGIASKGTWFEARTIDYAVKTAKKLKEKNIKTSVIFDFELKSHPEVLKVMDSYKIMPQKYSTGSSMDIFGDYVAIYSGVGPKALSGDITIFILKDKTLALDCKKWFEFMWDNLK